MYLFRKYAGAVRRMPWLAILDPRKSKKSGGHHRLLPTPEILFEIALGVRGIVPSKSINHYQNELLDTEDLRRAYARALERGQILGPHSWEDRVSGMRVDVVMFYALVRELQPAVIVETGTAGGATTSWLLAALRKNDSGKLISIDLPPVAGHLTMGQTIPREEVGFLVPEALRNRWDLIFGDSKVILPALLIEEQCDFFIHDSLHTRTHMLFEYNCARALMRPGSLILSDDILWNSSWLDFVKSHRILGLGCAPNPNLGLAFNEFDSLETSVGTAVIRDY